MDFISPAAAVVLCGLACGVVLGVAGRADRFCTLAMLRGVSGVLRIRLVEPLAIPLPVGTTQDLGSLVTAATGHDLRRPLAMLIALALAVWALADKGLRRSPRLLTSGLAVGLAVAAGWLATSYLGADDFEPARIASLTFVSPLGRTLMYVTTFSGTSADFGIASVFGVVLGSFATALADRRFRWRPATTRASSSAIWPAPP